MENSLSATVVGNVEIFGKTLRNFLQKSHYYLFYKPETRTAKLYVNHIGGGKPLVVFHNVGYEVARKFAENLGLLPDDEKKDKPLFWAKWNPVLALFHDGSSDAEALRMEMLRLGIPHVVHRDCPEFSLRDSGSIYKKPSWTSEKIMEFVREIAERYKEQLTTAP